MRPRGIVMKNAFQLEDLRIASPRRADWGRMIGDDLVRFCCSCKKNVYNLSSLTRDQAEALILAEEGRLCIRYYKRADGTVLTSDCPVGLREAARMAWVKLAAVAAACLAFVIGLVGFVGRQGRTVSFPSFGPFRGPTVTKRSIGQWCGEFEGHHA